MKIKFQNENLIKLLGLIFLLLFSISCKDETITNPDNLDSEFTNERKVTIIGYTSDAMEPFISKDERYLFFNNLKGPNSKDIYYAEKVNDTTFEFKGEVQGVNTAYVDGNPTMDADNNFYFISTRDLDSGNKTIFSGIFNNGTVTNLHKINGTINILTPYWINMGVEISKDGNMLFTSNAKFNIGDNFPNEGNIRFALKTNDEFNIPNNEADILANINTDNAIEYAGEISADRSELFYSQVTLSNPPVFKLFYAKRTQVSSSFGNPISITEPFKDDVNAFVEAPSLSNDGKRLYYHKLENGIFSIFMLSRD
ncbi:MAG: hypothetical protein GXO85_12970 [Chlorobi bacterium]|nr:hypothetical protein [Chlorobiota bacterium]